MSGRRAKEKRRQGGKGAPLVKGSPEAKAFAMRGVEARRQRAALAAPAASAGEAGSDLDLMPGSPQSASAGPQRDAAPYQRVRAEGGSEASPQYFDASTSGVGGVPIGSKADTRARISGSFVECMDGVFKEWFAGDSWDVWRVVAKSIFAEPLTPKELALFKEHTGRTIAQDTPAREVWLAIGRRGGKDYFVAALVVWLACVKRYRFNVGELGRVMLLAVDRDQAGVLYQYVTDLIDSIPQFTAMVTRRITKKDDLRIQLGNKIEILIKTPDKRRVRGRTLVAAVADEVAHWYSEEHHMNTDLEVLNAIRPSMLGVPGALLIAISSPHRRTGELYATDKQVWGSDRNPILFWRAATWEMRPDTAQHQARYPEFKSFLLAEKARDADHFWAEYGARYRLDLEDYLTVEQVNAVTMSERDVLPYQPDMRCYAFIDISGGEGQDSQALAIAARLPDGRGAICFVREWRPTFDATQAVIEVAAICKSYHVGKVYGDRFGGALFASMLRGQNLAYEVETRTATELYRGFAGAVTGKRIELLGKGETVKRGLTQIIRLEKRKGGEKITHPEREHDDVANALAGATLLACAGSEQFDSFGFGYNLSTHREAHGRPVDTEGTTYIADGVFRAASGERFRDPRFS